MTRLIALIGCGGALGTAIARGLMKQLDMQVAAYATLDDYRQAGDATPWVALVGPDVAVTDGLSLAGDADIRDAGSAVIIVADSVDTTLMRDALRAGVRDVLVADDGAEAITKAVLEAVAGVSSRRDAVVAAAPTEEAPALGKVITVFSPKGGVGKTVLSTNIGVALARDLGKRTILVDLDLEFGDVSVMLQVPPERTIFDAVQVFDRLDAEMLEGFLATHSSGLRLLLAPVRPEEAESVTATRIAQILTMLRTLADYVVVDTPASLSDVVLSAIETSDVVLAVATLDIPSVKNTRVALQKLHQLGLDSRPVKLVLNRADSKVWLDPQEIERAIADRILARIPSDRLVPRSVNKGVPVVVDEPKSAVARSLVALAREVAS